MNGADNHHGVSERLVVNGIRAVERHAKAWREQLARWPGQREVSQWLEDRLDRSDEARGNLRRCFGCQGGPNFGEVVLRCVG